MSIVVGGTCYSAKSADSIHLRAREIPFTLSSGRESKSERERERETPAVCSTCRTFSCQISFSFLLSH